MSTEISTNTAPARGLALASHEEPSFDSLVSMGDALRRTGFLPSHIKDGVSFAAIVLMGRELGMGTMAACRKLQVIKGTVTERADSQLARFKSCGGRAQFKELSEGKAVVWLRHPNGDEHVETFTMEDAKRAGLASNDNYAKHPKAMLRSRAITAGLKSLGWEGSVGIYDPDEISDATPEPAPAVKVTQPEPVVVRPKFNDTLATETPLGKARILVSKATTVERLEKLRSTADERLADGTFTREDHKSLCDLIHGKLDILLNAQDSGTEHFDGQEVEAEANAR
jgi:hypothetical protein